MIDQSLSISKIFYFNRKKGRIDQKLLIFSKIRNHDWISKPFTIQTGIKTIFLSTFKLILFFTCLMVSLRHVIYLSKIMDLIFTFSQTKNLGKHSKESIWNNLRNNFASRYTCNRIGKESKVIQKSVYFRFMKIYEIIMYYLTFNFTCLFDQL